MTCIHLFAYLFTCFIYLSIARCSGNGDRLLRLGLQGQQKIGTDIVTIIPSSDIFWNDYVKENKPLIFRGAARETRAYKYWTEEYLKSNYGNLTVRLEARTEGQHQLPVGEHGLGLESFSNFLDAYQYLDAYAITQLPEPMEVDVGIPACMRCGSFKNKIQEIHLFASAKGGKTLLHRDPYSSIHCVFNGSKDWVLVHPRQLRKLYMSESSAYEWGGFSEVNPMKIDLEKYPLISDVELSDVHLEKGDCIFMPGGYWHFVRSQGYMNTAVSIWFSRMDHYEVSSCINDETEMMPTADLFPIIWRYSGFGNLTQGHMDIYILKQVLLSLENDEGTIQLNDFVKEFMVLSEDNKYHEAMVKDINERILKFLDYFNVSSDNGIITVGEIEGLGVMQLKYLVEIIHPNDVSNTDQFEYSHFSADDVRYVLDSCLNRESSAFDESCIRNIYIHELGGSLAKANEIIKKLLPSTDEYESNDISVQIDRAVAPYEHALFHDPELERRLYKYLVQRKGIRDHDEL